MNICKYCKLKGMTLQDYNKFKEDIKKMAMDIRAKQEYKGGMFYNTSDLFDGIALQDQDEVKYFIIDELKNLDVEFRNNLEEYRITSNEYDAKVSVKEIIKNSKKELKQIYKNNSIKILVDNKLTKINVIDIKTNNIIYKHNNVYLNKDYFYTNIDNIALYFMSIKDNIKAHNANLENIFYNNKISMFNIVVSNIKKDIKEKQLQEERNAQHKQYNVLKKKTIKTANKLNIIIIETIKFGVLVFKANSKYLRFQNNATFREYLENLTEIKFNKLVKKEIDKQYIQPLNIWDINFLINTYKEIYSNLIYYNFN